MAKKLTTEVVRDFSQEALKNVLAIEKDSFPPEWEYADAEEYYSKFLKNKNNIAIILKDGLKIIGHILARPHDEALTDLKEDDPLMKPDGKRYYIETMAILSEYRGGYGYLDLTEAVIEEVKKRGANKFSMHIRRANGLSKSFQKFFGQDVTEIRFIEKWKWANGEPYDYIEAAYTKPIWYLKMSLGMYKFFRKMRKNFKK